MLAALEAELVVAGPGGARREIPVSHLLAGREMLEPAELIGFVRVPLLHAPQVCEGHRPHRSRPRHRLRRHRPGPGPARRPLRGRRHRPDAAAARWRRSNCIASLIDWDGERGLAPDALAAFGEYVAAACVPDHAPPADGQRPPPLSPAVLHLRRTVAALARRALGRALS
ncbi:Dehydrogenase OS=Streptomyces alboniger OX=132473 GN=CP975_13290 PE=4 SV=1 [Streptomyces alboniger]